jgi:branched-chain amino acid transport system permease protein
MSAVASSPASPTRQTAWLGRVAALLVLAAGVAAVELWGSRILVSLLAQAAIVSLLALGVGFLARTSGLVSFGHAAPFGLGAYGAAWALSAKSPIAPEIALALVPLAVALAFFLIGFIVSRLEGIAFGMLTLALGQATYVAATKFRGLTGGADGVIVELPRRLFGARTDALQDPYGMLIIAALALASMWAALFIFEATHTGRLAAAIRENEERVRFLGYRTRALKAMVFALSATIAALGGVLFALYQGFVSPEILHWSFSGSALIMSILGGTGALWGPIAGAFAFFFLREGLTELTTHWLAVLGATLILVTVAWPTGLVGLVDAALRVTGLLRGKGGVR